MNTKLNKSDLFLVVCYFIVDFTIQAWDYYRNGNKLIEYLIDFPVELITTCTIIYLFIFWTIPKFVIEKKYFTFTLLGVFIMIFFTAIEYTIGFWTGDNDWSKFPKGFDFILKMINRCSQNISLLFALLLTKKFYEGKTELLEIEKQQKENELKLLRSQIDPHFLFNNLNTLDSLIDTNSEKAKEYINRLSLIYRYLIRTKDAEVMELSEEVRFAENYIFLIKTRFANDYDFNIINNNSLEDTFIPTGALQAVLENVVKHNKVLNDATIKTDILIEEEWLTVTNSKSNSGTNTESLGTGLKNLKARYELLIDKHVQIIETNTEYRISIPIIKLSNEN